MKSRTQSKRWWLAGGSVAVVLVLLIGWFGVVEPQLSAAASTRDQIDSIDMQNAAVAASNTRLKEQNDNIATLRASLAAALAELPSDGGLPEFTRQISAQATASSVVLDSVVVGAATAVAQAVPNTETTASGTTDSGTTDSGTAGDTGTSTTTAATTAGSAGLVQMTITVTATGLGADNLAFLQAIQVTGPRRALVTASQLAPAESSAAGVSGTCTLTVTLNIFSAPLPPEAQVALQKLLSGG